jgi:hypothetical protein
MPYVQEDLANNKRKGGLQRLWEDESLHINMQNLALSEAGTIST